MSRLFDSLLKQSEANADSRPHCVIVVDDDPSIRESLVFLLGNDYDVVACASAKEGVEIIHDDVCAVILDVRMPGEDGFWACAEIRKKFPDMPVIFYSAYQDVKDPIQVINEHRPFGYISKGVEVDRLITMLRSAVEFRASRLSAKRMLHKLESERSTT
jgi:DNA-binding NtrC family response regulator